MVGRDGAGAPGGSDGGRDLVERWTSPGWRAEVEAWAVDALAGLARKVSRPITQPRVRFWSTQLVIPTDAGPVWFKENHPGQAFEAGLLSVLGGLVPGRVLPVLAVESQRGWFLADDQGPILRERLGAHPHPSETTAAWVRVATEWAQVQRELATRDDAVRACGLPVVNPSAAPGLLRARLAALAALPGGHPLALTPDLTEAARAAPARLEAAVTVLAELPVPLSLDHNDLHDGNAFAPPSPGAPLRFFDLGDAVWGHPFCSLFVPLRSLRTSGGPDPRVGPVGRALVEAYLDGWADLAPRGELERGLEAALVLANLHRLESWWRLVEGTPPGRYAQWGPWIRRFATLEAYELALG